LKRLKRDRPDLAAKVVAGALSYAACFSLLAILATVARLHPVAFWTAL